MKTPTAFQAAPSESIRAELRLRLLALNYHAFVQCLCLLLERLGYEDPHPVGRTQWKGRNREGGYDLEASLSHGFSPGGMRRRVIVQAKQFDTQPVFQRSVDELRGTCLRAEAAEALLITTSAFSPRVLQNASSAGVPVAPVRLLNGEELVDLMLRQRIGVWEEAGSSSYVPTRVEIDTAFFDELSRSYRDSRDRSVAAPKHITKEEVRPCTSPPLRHQRRVPSPADLEWQLTIRVERPGTDNHQSCHRKERP